MRKDSLHNNRRYFDDAPAAELQTIQTTDGDHGRLKVHRKLAAWDPHYLHAILLGTG